jgi:hypothetical protein
VRVALSLLDTQSFTASAESKETMSSLSATIVSRGTVTFRRLDILPLYMQSAIQLESLHSLIVVTKIAPI